MVDRTRTGSGSGSVFSEFGGFGVRFWAKIQSSDGFGVRFSKVRRVRSSVFIGSDTRTGSGSGSVFQGSVGSEFGFGLKPRVRMGSEFGFRKFGEFGVRFL